MQKDQRLDENIMPIIPALLQDGKEKRPIFQDIVQHGPVTKSLWHQNSSLELQNGLLFRRFEHPSGNKNLTTFQLVLTQQLILNTVKFYHGAVTAGQHCGRAKTLAMLRRYFYWPGMFEDVAWIIQQCQVCFKTNNPPRFSKLPLKLFKDGSIHGRWSVDNCGPFPQTKEGCKYILIAVEHFSSWPVAIPMKTQTSLETAQKLVEHVFSVYGSPISIHSDQGKNFESQLLKDVMLLNGISKTRSTSFHTKGNGKAEVFIRTLKQHLRMLVNQDQKDWPQHLPVLCQVHRGLPTHTTSYSPYEIFFGTAMRMPIDSVRGPSPSNSSYPEVKNTYKDYPIHLRQQLWKIHNQLREDIRKLARKMKTSYDKTANYIPFEEGQEVWL